MTLIKIRAFCASFSLPFFPLTLSQRALFTLNFTWKDAFVRQLRPCNAFNWLSVSDQRVYRELGLGKARF